MRQIIKRAIPAFVPVAAEKKGVISLLAQIRGVARGRMSFKGSILSSSDVKRWIEKDGEVFLMAIGIKEGQKVVDFGAGRGHYTIPAAKLAGENGKVYAFDKDGNDLEKLRNTASSMGINNIEIIEADTKVPLGNNCIDVILCYDVIHYLKDRTLIYDEAYRILKKDGIFSLYPKHCQDDFPLMELADVSREEVIEEVLSAGFYLLDRFKKTLLHDDYYNEGEILNFRKK